MQNRMQDFVWSDTSVGPLVILSLEPTWPAGSKLSRIIENHGPRETCRCFRGLHEPHCLFAFEPGYGSRYGIEYGRSSFAVRKCWERTARTARPRPSGENVKIREGWKTHRQIIDMHRLTRMWQGLNMSQPSFRYIQMIDQKVKKQLNARRALFVYSCEDFYLGQGLFCHFASLQLTLSTKIELRRLWLVVLHPWKRIPLDAEFHKQFSSIFMVSFDGSAAGPVGNVPIR